jgi:fused signal recognition particle receptor
MVFKFLQSSFKKLQGALARTGSLLGDKLRSIFSEKLDEEAIEKLEKILYEADIGVGVTSELIKKVREVHKKDPALTGEAMVDVIRNEIQTMLSSVPNTLSAPAEGPFIILIVGVNGNGKTTSIAKLAKMFKDQDKKVLVAAADTFRAAAIEQLEAWAVRIGVDVVKGMSKSDPAAVVFDAVSAGKSRGADIVLIDTAGRLHTKSHLMQELEKIKRCSQKVIPGSPHETLLVLDATTGQNAIDQAKVFHSHIPVSGLILTKLDGTAKGGIVIGIQRQLGIPIKFIGLGESMDDFEVFDKEAFVKALFT